MKLQDFGLVTDENIDPDVVAFLRQSGFDVFDVVENRLFGLPDVDLLRLAVEQTRVVVTHDSDFGTLTIHQREPLIGVIYLRPAHIDPQFTIQTVQAVIDANRELNPPFIVVAKRSANRIIIRVRTL